MRSESIHRLLQEIAPGSVLTAVHPLPGSFSNSSVLVEVQTAAGEALQFVVRRYAEAGGNREAKARREFGALALLAAHGVPVPRPIYLDEQGTLLGSPGIVISYVPGKQVCAPADPIRWAQEMAVTLSKIHSIPCGRETADFLLDGNSEVVWFLKSGAVPPYMNEHPDGAAVWHAVYDRLPGLQPVAPALTHIDYWSGNILWDGDRITTVLDWEEAACGDPVYDVAYCGMEMVLLGIEEAADVFLQTYVAESGRGLENLALWQLAAAVRAMPDVAGWVSEWEALGKSGLTVEGTRHRFRQFIADAGKQV